MTTPSEVLVSPEIFEQLQSKIEDDTKAREEIKDIVSELEKREKLALSTLSNAHSTLDGDLGKVAKNASPLMSSVSEEVQVLSAAASKHPYYKFNQMWSRQMQDSAFAVLLCYWLGGLSAAKEGQLLTIEQVGDVLKVPVNVKDRDVFHLSLEEYLHALVSLVDELARLARNSVTLGNYQRPLVISQFIKDLHAGFQVLNLKNDSLRRRSDSIKYKVREVEDVVYDLSLRGLILKT